MIDGLVSIVMPTMRPRRAVDTIQQTLITTQGHSLEFIVVTEDEAAKDAMTEFLSTYAGENLAHFEVIYQAEPRYPRVAWNDGLRVSRGEYIVMWADDVWPHPGWLGIALEAFGNFPDGVGLVGFNDLHWDGNILATIYIAHRQHVVRYQGGVLCFPPPDGGNYSDTETNARAKRAGRFVWAKDAVVEHLNWAFGKREKDAYDEPFVESWGRDTAEFQRREASGFPDDFEPAIRE